MFETLVSYETRRRQRRDAQAPTRTRVAEALESGRD